MNYMKQKFYLLVMALCAMMLVPQRAQADNDYMEVQSHYQVYVAGSDHIHIKAPVFASGGYNYHLTEGNIYTTVPGVGFLHICTVTADCKGVNTSDNGKGDLQVLMTSSEHGTLVVDKYDGTKRIFSSAMDNWSEFIEVKQTHEDGRLVTWFECDWYMPVSCAEKDIDIVIRWNFERCVGGYKYYKEWTYGPFKGMQAMMTPLLHEPFLYSYDSKGATGFGNAAVPYTVFYDVKSYHTSLDAPGVNHPTDSRADNIIIPTTDTVQPDFTVEFTVDKDKSIASSSNIKQTSTSVNIPPYHRIYDFSLKEELDSTGTYTGTNVVSWRIKNPELKDLMDGDMFEVQRALKSDFSDAKSIAVIPMSVGKNGKANYSITDASRDIWTGNAEGESDTLYYSFAVRKWGYELLDANGEPFALVNAVLSAPREYATPSLPVYYRVRRASSAVWGWVKDFSKTAKMEKHNYLAPLKNVQPDYTLDSEYETNHKVHFAIHIDNEPPTIRPILPKEKCKLSVQLKEFVCKRDVQVTFSYQNDSGTEDLEGKVKIRILDDEGDVFQDWSYLPAGTYTVPIRSKFEYQKDGDILKYETEIPQTGSVVCRNYAPNPGSFAPLGWYSLVFTPSWNGPEMAELESLKSSIIDSLYPQIDSTYVEIASGRCMWDRTAHLVLRRTIEETGSYNDFIIPQDSIVRQPDGSWIASFTDVANTACAHINYLVRIDQSNCDLRVIDTIQLQPVTLHGPSLYYDEGATITSFTASQGAAVGQQKRGVLLNWTPSSVAVDEYTLTRVAVNSDAAADTIYTGVDNTFFDETAVPNRHYEYVITAHYNCNGKSTANSASAEGWRSPYGEISGTIFMPDNSGLAGVVVTLTGDGLPETGLQRVTGADGTFLFDSLLYDISGTTQFAIVPTHTYAQFSYNYTSAQSASVTLSADHAVSSGIDFMNTSTTRLTGRALYKLSTIPVAGAMFTLNGDTVLRNGVPLQTGTDGNFELTVSKGQPYTLRIFKPGHTFEGEGILQVEEGKDTFALTKPLDAVRFYDETKVRLVGRVAGGIDQRDLPEAFGLGTNNIGDDVQLVLQLEGDNIAHFVHDPNDLSRDTFMVTVPQMVYSTDTLSVEPEKQVGETHVLMEKKRIVIHPDPNTGEYVVDLFPVKYKVIQATAKGYSTLFATGAGNETFDLTSAPLKFITDTLTTNNKQQTTSYNAVYDRIYRSPVRVQLKPLMYGMEQDGYGEPSLEVNGINPLVHTKVPLFSKAEDGTINYLLGYPVFYLNRKYQFEAQAYEDYYYNNDPSQRLDRVPQRGGSVLVHNGMVSSTDRTRYELNSEGKNRAVWLSVTNIQTQTTGTNALSTVSVALTDNDGSVVETDAFRAFVAGDVIRKNELSATDADITLLDIVRDPGGNGSSAWIESGSTYNYSYTESYDWEVGVELTPQWGLSVTSDIGAVAAPEGAGSYTGSTFNSSKQFSFTLPVTHEWSWGYKYNYTFSTNQKISTSTKKNKTGIGSNADVFFGVTTSVLTGKAQSVAIINDSLFAARKPARDAGMMRVLAEGVDADGNGFHLVTGEKVVMGSSINNSFVYSQYYILETVIPQLALERQSLLMTFPDEASAQARADALDEPVYWYLDSVQRATLQEPLDTKYYKMIVPSNSTKVYADRIAALNNILTKWMTIIIMNEREKVVARMMGNQVGTYSVSFGNTYTHSDSYSATANYNEMPQGWGLIGAEASSAATKVATDVIKSAKNIGDFFEKNKDGSFGTSAAKALMDFFDDDDFEDPDSQKDRTELGTVTNKTKFKLGITPVLSYDCNDRLTEEKTIKKSTGFTLVPDDQGDITVSVYRANLDTVWQNNTADIRENVEQSGNDELYGSYVFFTQAGATYCVHEKEEKTQFYNPGTVINNGTMAIAKPEISINTYEVSNVPSDQRAKFIVELKNAGQELYGFPSTGTTFALSLTTASNPHGAKVYMNGAPLVQGLSFFLTPGQVVRQVMEVERGEVDDYENLELYFNVGDCPKTYTFLNFSVHFIPEAGPVAIASPRQNWVMNTLSPHDSVGYYLPIDISGFDIHYKNFDHIEFQYKLTKESDEMWVNSCSFYADDSLYNMATGSKAMIENGKITPFRFYGERDPMEQEYDLRAVCFCRYGSGFVSKASPVISGVKDTRPPVLFGDPQPANAVLGIGDDLKLRFSEPIAGNYLDEDNNFQLKGVTNETGITAGTSIHFNGSADSYAKTQISRSLTGRSFSLDMLVRPSDPNKEEKFFSYEVIPGIDFLFGKTADNRLFAQVGQERVTSKPLESPMLAFTRVILSFDNEKKTVRFFAGTSEVTDPSTGALPDETTFNVSSPLVYGQGFEGEMLEARLWSKALTLDEIAATNGHYLTGYERELLAYYRMNEGKGDSMTDRANGANLSLSNATWVLQKGISIALNNEAVQLAGDLLARSQGYDETLMFWFKTSSTDAPLFRAGWVHNDSVTVGTLIAMDGGKLVLLSGTNLWTAGSYADGEWHHVALTLSRSYNTAALFVDGKLTNTAAATKFGAISGAMYLGGEGFKGNIDEFAVFEQALPAAMVQEYYNASPVGDEMGLMGYLPFEEQKLNPNGVLEQVFSINDQRQFRDANGNVVEKVVPLVVSPQPSAVSQLADKANFAPTSDKGLFSKLNFGWTFNQEELLINLKMLDNEINKQNIYITVRDVEDLHGNPMPSPVSWTAFVDRCPLRWDMNTQDYYTHYGDMTNEPGTKYCYQDLIINTTGKRHQFKIESLPDWLTAEPASGSIDPLESKPIYFCPDYEMPVGVYTDIVYLTDENGLSEPVYIEYTVEAVCPWESSNIDQQGNTNTMSLRGQVYIESEYGSGYYDTDERDQVAVFCEGQLVGLTNNTFATNVNTSYVYLTINGNSNMAGRPLSFKLWQASSGKIYNLTPSARQTFIPNAMRGISPEEPIRLSTSAGEIQQLSLTQGWNWISWYVRPANDQLDYIFPMESGFSDGDLIKSPTSQSFAELTYIPDGATWRGSLRTTNYKTMYMMRVQDAVNTTIEGKPLNDEQRTLTIRKGWNGIAYLLSEPASTRDALADYFDKATVGDIIKSHTQFAVFTENGKWEGSLQSLRPGQGYLLKRLASGSVTMQFVQPASRNMPKKAPLSSDPLSPSSTEPAFTNPHAASNMTMIAKVESEEMQKGENIRVFIGDELVGTAESLSLSLGEGRGEVSLYFFTIQSDVTGGTLRFETEDGESLTVKRSDSDNGLSTKWSVNEVVYVPNAHLGSLKSPVILTPYPLGEGRGEVYKLIEDDHVIIIRNGVRYDVTGKKLE